jgi:spermidine/putrescine transport system permease protein
MLIIIFSFNSSQIAIYPLEEFSLRWYQELFADRQIFEALLNTIIVGVSTVFISLLLGIPAAFGLNRINFPGKSIYNFVVTMPFVLPEIVTGVALLSFFIYLGMQLTIGTVLIGHVVFCLSVAIRTIGARLQNLSRSYEESSYDLGASGFRTFFKVTLPNIRTAIITASLLIFTISFDETVITIFTVGAQNTLPMVVWGMMRRGFTPKVNALATFIFMASLIMIVFVGLRLREEK